MKGNFVPNIFAWDRLEPQRGQQLESSRIKQGVARRTLQDDVGNRPIWAHGDEKDCWLEALARQGFKGGRFWQGRKAGSKRSTGNELRAQ